MADKKGGSLLGGILGAAAVAGAAKVISDLEKQAKEEGVDILDVAKQKAEDIVEDVKSGELAKNVGGKIGDTINDVIDDVKSGELQEKVTNLVEDVKTGEIKDILSDKAKDVIEDVKSDEFKQKAGETLTNLKDGVIDILDGKKV